MENNNNILLLPGRNSRARKRFLRKRATQRVVALLSKLEAFPEFDEIRTKSDLEELALNDPFLFLRYVATGATA